MRSTLIRDKVKPNCANNNRSIVSIPDTRLHIPLLIGKLHEKAQEIAGDVSDPEKYASLFEVVSRLMELGGVSKAETDRIAGLKFVENGGFNQCRILHTPRFVGSKVTA